VYSSCSLFAMPRMMIGKIIIPSRVTPPCSIPVDTTSAVSHDECDAAAVLPPTGEAYDDPSAFDLSDSPYTSPTSKYSLPALGSSGIFAASFAASSAASSAAFDAAMAIPPVNPTAMYMYADSLSISDRTARSLSNSSRTLSPLPAVRAAPLSDPLHAHGERNLAHLMSDATANRPAIHDKVIELIQLLLEYDCPASRPAKRRRTSAGNRYREYSFESIIDLDREYLRQTGEHWFTIRWSDGSAESHLVTRLFPREGLDHPAVQEYLLAHPVVPSRREMRVASRR
jgi:hypothetical protein